MLHVITFQSLLKVSSCFKKCNNEVNKRGNRIQTLNKFISCLYILNFLSWLFSSFCNIFNCNSIRLKGKSEMTGCCCLLRSVMRCFDLLFHTKLLLTDWLWLIRLPAGCSSDLTPTRPDRGVRTQAVWTKTSGVTSVSAFQLWVDWSVSTNVRPANCPLCVLTLLNLKT